VWSVLWSVWTGLCEERLFLFSSTGWWAVCLWRLGEQPINKLLFEDPSL
jgi:hypothetical protein